jgi:hypothetical protein
MMNEWSLQSAKIVIPVLSGVTNHKPFKNQKLTEALRNGIKNVILIHNDNKFNHFLLGSKCIRSMVYNQWY